MSNEKEVLRQNIWKALDLTIFKQCGYKVCIGWWDCCEGSIGMDKMTFSESGQDDISLEDLYDQYDEEKAEELKDISLNQSLKALFSKNGVKLEQLIFNLHTQEPGKTSNLYGGILYAAKKVIETLVDEYDIKHLDMNQMVSLIRLEMKKANPAHKFTYYMGQHKQFIGFEIADDARSRTFSWSGNKSKAGNKDTTILKNKILNWNWCVGKKNCKSLDNKSRRKKKK
eukprot:201193_1